MLPHLQKILLKIFGFILKCWVCGLLKTVNFDDPATYHFYFGNQNGEPGTIITFFLFREAAREPWEKGRPEEFIFPCRKEHSRFGSAGLKKTACL